MRGHAHRGSQVAVTVITQLRLRFLGNLTGNAVNSVAIGAIHIGGIVCRELPVIKLVTVMAGQAKDRAAKLVVIGRIEDLIRVAVFDVLNRIAVAGLTPWSALGGHIREKESMRCL